MNHSVFAAQSVFSPSSLALLYVRCSQRRGSCGQSRLRSCAKCACPGALVVLSLSLPRSLSISLDVCVRTHALRSALSLSHTQSTGRSLSPRSPSPSSVLLFRRGYRLQGCWQPAGCKQVESVAVAVLTCLTDGVDRAAGGRRCQVGQ